MLGRHAHGFDSFTQPLTDGGRADALAGRSMRFGRSSFRRASRLEGPTKSMVMAARNVASTGKWAAPQPLTTDANATRTGTSRE